jgi:hypothetical protein
MVSLMDEYESAAKSVDYLAVWKAPRKVYEKVVLSESYQVDKKDSEMVYYAERREVVKLAIQMALPLAFLLVAEKELNEGSSTDERMAAWSVVQLVVMLPGEWGV